MAKSLISLMRKMYLLSAITVCASLVGLTSTHPGDDSELEIQIREEALRGMPLDLSHCSYKMKVRGVTVDAVERRTKIAREARISRGLNAGICQLSYDSPVQIYILQILLFLRLEMLLLF